MTITAYTGLPGHGKSYGVVENVIVPCLRKMRSVFTNIPMNSEKCLAEFGITPTQFDVRDIVDNPNWWTDVFIPGSVLVLDEAWRLWPSGLKTTNVREQDKAFLAEHRHMVGDDGASTDIVIVTQDLQQIASFARCLVETTYLVTKLVSIGFDKVFRVDVYSGAVTGSNPPASRKIDTVNGKRTKYIENLYVSHTKSAVGAGDETRVDKRANVLLSQRFYFYLGLVVVAILIFVFAIQSTLASYGLTADDHQAAPVAATSPVKTIQVQTSAVADQPAFKFLSLASEVYIAYNNGAYPDIKYVLSVKVDETVAELTIPNLMTLDYKVTPITSCLLIIKGPDYHGPVMCQASDRKQGFIQKAVTEGKI